VVATTSDVSAMGRTFKMANGPLHGATLVVDQTDGARIELFTPGSSRRLVGDFSIIKTRKFIHIWYGPRLGATQLRQL